MPGTKLKRNKKQKHNAVLYKTYATNITSTRRQMCNVYINAYIFRRCSRYTEKTNFKTVLIDVLKILQLLKAAGKAAYSVTELVSS